MGLPVVYCSVSFLPLTHSTFNQIESYCELSFSVFREAVSQKQVEFLGKKVRGCPS